MNLREQIEKTLDFSDDVGLTEDQLKNLLHLILALSPKTYGIATTQPNVTLQQWPPPNTIITSNGTIVGDMNNKI